MTTLDDLRRAINAIETQTSIYSVAVARAVAWRNAFEWRDSIPAGGSTDEYLEGMRLIKEHLE